MNDMSLTDDIRARLNGLDPETLQKVEVLARNATKGMCWLPNTGPQTDAYFHPADTLLYGGQGGGGKTDLGLGLALTAHNRSLILRRKYANLGSITERALEIHGTRDGYNGSPPPLLRTKDGRYVQFAGNQHLGDEQDWQGQPFDFKCVGRGTLVRMPNGSYRAIEAISAGDFVDTLEGPKRVNKVWPIRRDKAVRVVMRDAAGAFVCYQDQSLTHEVLAPSGWVIPGKSGVSCQLSTYEPTQSNEWRKLSELFSRPYEAVLRLLKSLSSGLRPSHAMPASFQANAGSMASGVCAGPQRPERGGVGSCASHQGLLQLPGLSGLPVLLSRFRGLYAGLALPHISGSRAGGGRFSSTLQGSADHCSAGSRLYGGRVLRLMRRGFEQASSLFFLPLQSGAAQPIPNGFVNGGRGETPRCNSHTGTYCHPYTKEIRQVSADVTEGLLSFEAFPIGEIDLYDIEVDHVNHFITAGGVVNKNCFDEAVQFLEDQVRFHLGWLRSTKPGQRCRAVLATNPPVDADGDWIIKMFRPWLDITHHKPAKAGEMRWFITAPDGSDLEVDGPETVQLPGAKDPVIPSSRSFIPAALRDNPYLIDTGYQAKLDGLLEPLRSAVRDGNFMIARADSDMQVIPMQWIIEAQARWKPDGFKGFVMTAAALDIGAGRDETSLACRYGGWFAPVQTMTGEPARDPSHAAAMVVKHRKDNCPIVVDVGGGFGGPSMMLFKEQGIECLPFNASNTSKRRSKDGQMSFFNKRAEAWWTMREELDPSQEGGSPIALPPDPQLRSDLAAPTWKMTTRGIQIETKDDIKDRISRSPDRGDSVVMCLSEGNRAVARRVMSGMIAGRAPKVTGQRSLKR